MIFGQRFIGFLFAALVLVGLAGSARAERPFDKIKERIKDKINKKTEFTAPELDPTAAATALALIGGGVAVLHGRRRARR